MNKQAKTSDRGNHQNNAPLHANFSKQLDQSEHKNCYYSDSDDSEKCHSISVKTMPERSQSCPGLIGVRCFDQLQERSSAHLKSEASLDIRSHKALVMCALREAFFPSARKVALSSFALSDHNRLAPVENLPRSKFAGSSRNRIPLAFAVG